MIRADSETEDRAREETPEDAPGVVRRLLKWISAAFLTGLMVGGGHLLLRWEPQYLPVRLVVVDGDVHRLPLNRLQETVLRHLDGGILTLDLDVLKDAVEGLAWVDTASMRRVWPDQLVLSVQEHDPVALWGENGLVTAAGIVFRPDEKELPRGLPRLAAEDDQSLLVVRRYQDWRPRFEALGLGLVAVSLDARGAWTLQTDKGFTLALGTERTGERIGRFLQTYPRVAAVGRPATVDMRYSNGLAVSWKGSREDRDPEQGSNADALGPGAGLMGEGDAYSPTLDNLPAGARGTRSASRADSNARDVDYLPRPSALGPRPFSRS